MMKATSKLPVRISFLIVFLGLVNIAQAFELVCPADVTLDCNEYIYDLSQYGNAQYKDYNGWHDAGYPVVDYDLNHCDQGTITRTWTVYNPYGNVPVSCSQTIYIGGSTFSESNITWPLSGIDVSGCNPNLSPNALPAGYQQPTWTAGTCAMIGSSYTDKVFYFSGACKKVVREWELINCCDFNIYTGEGVYRFFQEINVTISDVPQVTCPEDVTVESYNCVGSYVEVPGIIIPDSDCSDAVTIMNDSPYATSGSDASGNYPIGTTVVTFTADYGCWQKTMCQVEVVVTDNTTPTPYCIYGLSIALMGIDTDGDGVNDEGMVEVWASDLDKGSFASCNDDDVLQFSFSSDPDDTFREFTCDDVGRNDVEIWVTDEQGRQNYCNTYIRVQNNAANIEDCEDSDEYSTLSGHVTAHYGETPKNIQLRATATSHEGIETTSMEYTIEETVIDSFVNSTGTTIYYLGIDTVWQEVTNISYPTTDYVIDLYGSIYEFVDMQHFHDYTIHGIGEDVDRTLINDGDVSDLKAYLEGEIPFTAYQKLAADVDQDGIISQNDVQLLEDIIAGVDDIEIDDSWHFYDAGMDMENIDDDHECEEFCRVADLQEDTYKVNLVGYRLGDITNVDVDGASDESIANKSIGGTAFNIEGRDALRVIDCAVSPNPFNNQINLHLTSENKGTSQFILRNSVGHVVFTQSIHVEVGINDISIALDNIETAGIYLYEVQMGKNIQTGKLIHIK